MRQQHSYELRCFLTSSYQYSVTENELSRIFEEVLN